MLQNNNKIVINKLSKRILKVNKMRNICAILGIILTTLLITVTISGGITFYNANKEYEVVSRYGVNSDGYFSIDKDSESKLRKVKTVDKIGISQLASIEGIKNKELLNERVNLETADKDCYEMMSIVPIKGDYPKKANEALVPTWVLDVLEVDKKVGEKIKLDIVINDKVKTIEFVLSGYYESLVGRGSEQTKVFVSDNFIEEYNKKISGIKNTKTAYVNLNNLNKKSNYSTVKNEMKDIKEKIGVDDYKAHPKHDEGNNGIPVSEDLGQIIALAIGILIVIFTGYLIIYNIFHISIAKDVRFYGLLKTVGTTSKQLKKIIIKQAMILSVIGIPIGIILGYLVARIVVPLALKPIQFGSIAVVSFNMYMVLFSVIFSLITVLISCNKPARQAGKVSPIEAVRYVDIQGNSKKKVKRGAYGAKIYKMAWRNIVKNKKRVILSIISISLSAITVIFTINATMGLDPKKHADTQMMTDVEVENNLNTISSTGEYEPITEELINKIANLDVVESIDEYYGGMTPNKYGKVYLFGTEITIDQKFKKELESYGDPKDKYLGFNYVPKGENTINTQVRALKSQKLDKEVKMLNVMDGTIDKEKFKTGNYIIYYVRQGKANTLKAGDKLKLKFSIRDTKGQFKQIEKDLEIMAIVADKDQWSANNLQLLNIEENAFKSIFPEYKNYIEYLHIQLKDAANLKKADDNISKIIIESGNGNLKLTSKNFYIEGIKSMKIIMLSIGAIISSILGLIGIINVINTVITGIFSRKIEFAMLESIGMTKKQTKKMIRFEGIYYIMLTSLLIIPLGIGVAFVAPMVLPIYGGFNPSICSMSIIISIVIIGILLISIPSIGYKMVSKESIVERLKVIE